MRTTRRTWWLTWERHQPRATIRSRTAFGELLTYYHGPAHWKVTDARLAVAYLDQVARMTPEQRRRLDQVIALAGKEGELWGQGKYREALPVAEQALAIYQELFGEESAPCANWKRIVGDIHFMLNAYAAAEPYYHRAVALRRELLGDAHPTYALSLEELADLYRARYDYARAEPLYQQALDVRRRALGPDHADTARSLNRLAAVYLDTGRNTQAEPLLQRAIAVARKAAPSALPFYLQNLGGVYKRLGDSARAEPLYRQAVDLLRTAAGGGRADLALGLAELAIFYRSVGDWARAEPLFLEALEIQKEELGDDAVVYAGTLVSLADGYLDRREPDRAEPLLVKALAIRKKALGEDHPEYVFTMNRLAWLYVQRGEYDRAEPIYRRDLEVTRRVHGEGDPEYAACLSNLADFHFARGDPGRAAPYYLQALDLSRRGWQAAAAGGRSQRQQLILAQGLRWRLDLFLSAAPRAGLIAEEEYPYVLAWKGMVLDRQRWDREQQRVLRERKPEAAQKYAELQSVSARLAALAFAPPEERRKESHLKELRDLTDRKEKLEGELARLSNLFRQRQAAAEPTAGQLRAALPAGTALVDFLEYTDSAPLPPGAKSCWAEERRLVAYVVRPGRPVVGVRLGPAGPVEAAVERWREAAGAGRPAPDPDPGAELRRLVWQPLQEHLDGVRTVLVSPDGALARFPFAALPGRAAGTYLIEELAVAVLPVPRLLPELAAAPAAGGDAALLVMGDVDFGAPSGTGGPGADAPAAGAVRAGMLSALAPLDGTRAEVSAVRRAFEQRFPDGKVRPLGRDQATKEAFRQQAPKARWLHLATHGFFAPPEVRSALDPPAAPGGADRAPELFAREGVAGIHPGLLSGLVLAGANRPTDTDNGVLTALEVESLDLGSAELVVLSACETGLGRTAGGEGLLGLQRAFQVAGARTVVAGLWKVDDAATRALMAEFYRNLWDGQQGKLEALRQAQLAMLRSYDPRQGRLRGVGGTRPEVAPTPAGGQLPPFYWAAFTLSGDWR
jgi:CHAT domain-containing protein/Tfp pilus assembly protein PilF